MSVTLKNLKLTLTRLNLVTSPDNDTLMLTLAPFYTGATGANATAANVSLVPDAAIDLDSSDVQSGMQEVAGDIHDLNNGPDLVLLYMNSLL